MPTISLPNGWKPRHYQKAVWRYFAKGGTRAGVAWHRRAGKDDVALHLAACKAHERIGTYWHMLPEYAQGRKAIWKAVNPHTGLKRIDEAFPPETRKSTNEQEMFIEFKCGSTWQVVGSDSYDRVVGSAPVGVVFSEYALANPSAWAFIRPILAENGGFAFFISTFRGRNHHYKLVQSAQQYDDWFGEVLSARETGVFTPEQLEREHAEYVSEFGREEGDALFRQEYYSDPNVSIQGAYYGAEVKEAEDQGRVARLAPEPGVPVETWWDLGFDDETAIWFVQIVGRELRVIDFLQDRNRMISDYAADLRAKGYDYSRHVLPHDGGNSQLSTGMSLADQLMTAGLQNVITTKRPRNSEDVLAGINEGRKMIKRAWFDTEKTELGREALLNYRREWDDKNKTYKRTPLHDWASHPADAWRTGAMAWQGFESTADTESIMQIGSGGWMGG